EASAADVCDEGAASLPRTLYQCAREDGSSSTTYLGVRCFGRTPLVNEVASLKAPSNDAAGTGPLIRER
ncbi:hypothetical protein LTR60_007229, partial [Cryomyces antarcticus]